MTSKSNTSRRRRVYQLLAVVVVIASAIPIGAIAADAQTDDEITESDYDFKHTLLFLDYDADILGTPSTVNVTLTNQTVTKQYTIDREDRIGSGTAVGQYHYIQSDIENPTVESVERLDPQYTQVIGRSTEPTIRSVGTPETSVLNITIKTAEPIDWSNQRFTFHGQNEYRASNTPNIGTLEVKQQSPTKAHVVANATYPDHPGWSSIEGPVHVTMRPLDSVTTSVDQKYPITDISASSGPLIAPPSSQGPNGTVLFVIIVAIAAYLYAK